MITRENLIEQLSTLPHALADAEGQVILKAGELRRLKSELEDAEAAVLLGVGDDGERLVNGKNAEERAAQIRYQTREVREDIEQAQCAFDAALIGLKALQGASSCLRSVARLLEGTRD